MFNKCFLNIILLLLITFNLNNVCFGQNNDFYVSKVTIEANNQLLINISTENTKIRIGEDFPITLNITSYDDKPIYLVKGKNPKIISKFGNIDIDLTNPPPKDNGEEYDFSFNKIDKNANYSEKIIIPGKFIKEQGLIRINVGLGFVFDKTDIDRKLKKGEDPLVLHGPLNYRLIGVNIGELTVESKL